MVLWGVADVTSPFDPLLHRLHEHLRSAAAYDHDSNHEWVVPPHGSIHPHLEAFVQPDCGLLPRAAVQVQCGYTGFSPRCEEGAFEEVGLVVLYRFSTSPTRMTKKDFPVLQPTPSPGNVWSFGSSLSCTSCCIYSWTLEADVSGQAHSILS